MAKIKRTATIQDVAREAGVSVSTVSRVINGKDDVSQGTRDRVQSVISEIGYTSNLAAKSMRSLKKNLLGLVVPDIGLPYAIEIMKGISEAIAESSSALLVYTTGVGNQDPAGGQKQDQVSLLNNSLTDGVIIVASAAAGIASTAPIVVVDPHEEDPIFTSVLSTDYQGTLDAMAHLIGLGHSRIGFIRGREDVASSSRRLKGYKDALQHAGIVLEDGLIVPGDFTTETGYLRGLDLLKMDHPPTAILAANDQMAIGVYQAAEELGLSIPNDVSVIGFDNISEAKCLGLTTVDQSLCEMGVLATNLLIKLVNEEPLDKKLHIIPSRLVQRKSCRQISSSGETYNLK